MEICIFQVCEVTQSPWFTHSSICLIISIWICWTETDWEWSSPSFLEAENSKSRLSSPCGTVELAFLISSSCSSHWTARHCSWDDKTCFHYPVEYQWPLKISLSIQLSIEYIHRHSETRETSQSPRYWGLEVGAFLKIVCPSANVVLLPHYLSFSFFLPSLCPLLSRPPGNYWLTVM